MKKNLFLIASLFLVTGVSAQFTHGNSPEIDEGTVLYEIDVNSPSYSAVTGTAASWDYSEFGYAGNQRSITVSSASETAFASEYPSSTTGLTIENLLTNFYTNTETEGRISQGFVFSEASLGDAVIKFTSGYEELQITYPFDVDSLITGTVQGTVAVNVMGADMDLPFTGTYTATVDGKGTLKLSANEYTDVYRYKIVENITVDAGFFGTIVLNREQYEYYDFATSTLPILVYVDVELADTGGSLDFSQKMVLSHEQPGFDAEEPDDTGGETAISTNILDNISIYPNPTVDQIHVTLPEGVSTATITIVDGIGRTVYTSEVNEKSSINVSSFNKGTYFMTVEGNNASVVKPIVIK